jgi:hypothetical protein
LDLPQFWLGRFGSQPIRLFLLLNKRHDMDGQSYNSILMNNLRSLEVINILRFASIVLRSIDFFFIFPIDWQLIAPTVTLRK